jgi:hypothetical protein
MDMLRRFYSALSDLLFTPGTNPEFIAAKKLFSGAENGRIKMLNLKKGGAFFE